MLTPTGKEKGSSRDSNTLIIKSVTARSITTKNIQRIIIIFKSHEKKTSIKAGTKKTLYFLL